MIHPDTELQFISKEKGYGVVATKLIPKGTVTWVKDKLDRTFTNEDLNAFGLEYIELLEKYCYIDNQGRSVLCWDIARFVNHSFNSNCISTPYDFEIAVRDIFPGEELTDDYGYLNVSEPFECIPEAGTDRTHVYPDDLLRYYNIWDEKVRDSYRFFKTVDQPLKKFFSTELTQITDKISKGKMEMGSILECYYKKE